MENQLPPGSQDLNPNQKNNLKIWVPVIVVILVAVGVATYFWLHKGQSPDNPNLNIQKAEASNFATYQETPVNVKPQVPEYKPQSDLSNVSNRFMLSDKAKQLLAQNDFVIVPEKQKEFFQLYEPNRYAQLPSFITTDSMLHNYHVMFDYLLKKLEEDHLSAELKNLNGLMLQNALDQYNSLKGTQWENAAKRNVGFFAVSSKLLDSQASTPDIVKNEVEQELKLIDAHQGIAASPVMNLGSDSNAAISTPQGELPVGQLLEDYSQYVPRGHYDKSDLLRSYFKAMMWYGRLTFRFKNPDEVKSAMLITLSLGGNQPALTSWDKIYEPTNFFVGKSDDITYFQLSDVFNKVYGNNISLQNIVRDENKFTSFQNNLSALEAPQINSVPIFNAAIQPDREKEIKGFRFMGQRFTLDASIFQRLIYREVGTESEARMLPKGLDIPAAMGSDEALNLLKGMGEDKYQNYTQNMDKLRNFTAGINTETWTQNLYWGWLYQLLPLLEVKPEGYPSFMRSVAWNQKGLNTYLASWTELKHDTILYAKQSYAELGGGGDEEKLDDRGYVEPEVYTYARLASLVKMTKEGLAARGLLDDSNTESLDNLEQLSLDLKNISEKELNNQTLSDADYELIRSYGGQIEHIWYDAYKEECGQATQYDCLDVNPAPIVADVATDPNGEVLEEGTGYVNAIYVVVPVDGKLRVAKGGVYSYYEFTQPISDRLTDTKWREILNSNAAPNVPAWVGPLMSE